MLIGSPLANGTAGVAQDPAEARKWLIKAARQNFDTAQYDLGIWYLEGIGGERDLKKAFVWTIRAARAGNDGLQAPAAGGLGVGEHLVGHAVGRHDARLEGDTELGQNLGRQSHRLPVAAGAHDDADDGLGVLGGWGGQGLAPGSGKP